VEKEMRTMAKKSTSSVSIKAPLERVFTFLTDPAHWMLAVPNTDVTETKLTPEGVGTTAHWHARILGIPASVVHEYVEFVPNQRIVSKANTGFVLTFTFAGEDDGTRLTLDVDWGVHVPVVDAALQAVAVKFVGDMPEEVLTKVKAALESSADWRDTYAARRSVVHSELKEGIKTTTKLTKSIVIDAPVETVFDYLKDPAESWVDMATRVHNVKPTPQGVGTTFEWESKMFGFHVTGTNEFTEFVPNQRLVVTASKGFVFSFTLAPDGAGTRLTLAEEDVPANWAVAAFDAVAMKLTERDIDNFLANIKTAVEAKAG
jgi:uncharacterized protein YndB with AHSA1/START domain